MLQPVTTRANSNCQSGLEELERQALIGRQDTTATVSGAEECSEEDTWGSGGVSWHPRL